MMRHTDTTWRLVRAAMIFLCLGLILVSCSNEKDESSEKTIENMATRTYIMNHRELCEEYGGQWREITFITGDVLTGCNLPTTDGGTVCQDGSACQGECVVEDSGEAGKLASGEVVGVCSDYHVVLGCIAVADDGELDYVCSD